MDFEQYWAETKIQKDSSIPEIMKLAFKEVASDAWHDGYTVGMDEQSEMGSGS